MNVTTAQSTINSLNTITTLLQNENINIKLDNENIKTKLNSVEVINSENKNNLITLENKINSLDLYTNDNNKTIEKINSTINNLQTSDNLVKQAMIQLNNSITTIQNSNNTLTSDFNKNSKNTINVNTIFEKAKYSCSSIYFTINEKSYVGTGFFITLDESDLTSGLFLTAAHCVIEIDTKNNIHNVSDMLLLNPINNNWININTNNIFIDGIADIALIKTYIDFSLNKNMCLKLAEHNSNIGDLCYIIGNSSNIDSNGISFGIIKDTNYSEPGGYQIVNSIYISTNGLSGYSGCPILDISCNIIGIYTFGISSSESVGGGANLDTLIKSLSILKTYSHNKLKRYLGFDWNIPNPFVLKKFLLTKDNNFINKGVLIYEVSTNSPFYGFLNSGDLLLGVKNRDTNEIIDFGSNYNQYSPGILIYNYHSIVIDFYYIKKNTTTIIQQTIALNKTYFDVPNYLDGPLQGGLNLNNKNITRNIIQRKKII
jgi:S1-C subfamily serine protease